MTPIIVVRLLGVDKFANSLGFIYLLCGAAALTGPPFAGEVLLKESRENQNECAP